MAISGGDGSIILTTKVDETGLKKGLGSMKKLGATAGKTFLAIGAAAAAATVAITKMAVSAYADYEQLVGGVETLFKGSAQKVIDYANDAFYTAGISANDYMKQVIGISASLINSSAGNTEKAADIANMAIIDMSDNVNKLGTDMERVQMAYAGFARNQYQLLDNLALGYQGTKTEMERLLRDAEAYMASQGKSVKYNIDNLSDVYSAIHAIQEKMGVAGTTVAEAEKTITGSANMMKASWQNVLSAIAGGGDLDRAINNLVYSIQKYFENIVPVVQRSLVGIGRLIEKVAPMLVQNVASALIQSIPSLINAVFQMIVGLAKGIIQGIKALFTGKGGSSITAQISSNVSEIGSSADIASEGISGMGEAAKGAGKAAKGAGKSAKKAGEEAKKTLASFDDINILSEKGGSAGSDGTGGAGGAGGSGTPSIGGGGTPSANFVSDVSGVEETGGVFSDLAETLNNIFNNLKNDYAPSIAAWSSAFDTVKNSWNEAKPSFVNGAINIKNAFVELGSYLLNNFVPNVVNSFSTNLAPVVGDSFGFIIKEAGKQFEWAGQRFGIYINDMVIPHLQLTKLIATDVFSVIGNAWDVHGASLLSSFSNSFEALRNNIDNFYNTTFKPISDKILEVLNFVWAEGLKPLVAEIVDAYFVISEEMHILYSEVIAPILDWIMNNILPPIVEVVNGIIEIIGNLLVNIMGIAEGIIKAIKGIIQFLVGVFTGDWKKAWNGIKTFFEGIWKSIKELIGALITILEGLAKIIVDVVAAAFKIAWESIKLVWETVVGFFQGVWNGIVNVFSSVSTWFSNMFTSAWNGIKFVWDTAVGYFQGVWNGIVNVFNSTGTWFSQTFSGAWQKVTEAFSSVGEFFTGVWNSITQVFGTASTWFRKTFEDAWTAVKNVFSKGGEIFSGIVDGVVTTFKKIVNALIAGINSVVRTPFQGLNKVLDKIEGISIAGIKPFDWLNWRITIPQIPYLAKGAVIPGGREFLAVLGDQPKGQTNIEAPLQTIVDAFNIALAQNGGRNSGNTEVILEIDGREFGRAVVEQGNRENRRIGTRLVIA